MPQNLTAKKQGQPGRQEQLQEQSTRTEYNKKASQASMQLTGRSTAPAAALSECLAPAAAAAAEPAQ
jgi:hypothetical protein